MLRVVRVGGGARSEVSELGRDRFPENEGARLAQPADSLRLLPREEFGRQARAGARGEVIYTEDILDADGHSVEGRSGGSIPVLPGQGFGFVAQPLKAPRFGEEGLNLRIAIDHPLLQPIKVFRQRKRVASQGVSQPGEGEGKPIGHGDWRLTEA